MTIKLQKGNIGLGKRKRAVERVFLVPGEGNLIINKVAGDKYLQYNSTYINQIWNPLKKLNLEKNVTCKRILENNFVFKLCNLI